MNRKIKKVLSILDKNNYEAYIVGGYVRDKILNIKSFDIDICTNAKPDQVIKLFPNSKGTSYGSCSFKNGKYTFDITTYREELKYKDRKPIEIKYVNTLKEDLVRRDFTINAICMNKKGLIIDKLNGQKDISGKTIKIVGDANLKLKEDPLRILRAIRFATKLNFSIDEDSKKSIIKNKNLLKKLSIERIKSELSEIVISKNYEYGLNLIKELSIDKVLLINVENIKFVSNRLLMLMQLNLSEDYFSKKENSDIKKLKKIINYGTIDNTMLYTYDFNLCLMAAELMNISKKQIKTEYNNMWINKDKPLKIKSYEIKNELKIKENKELGIVIKKIENLILEKELRNSKKAIKKYLKK